MWRYLAFLFLLACCSRTSAPGTRADGLPSASVEVIAPKVEVISSNVAATLDDDPPEKPFFDPDLTTSVGSPSQGYLVGSLPLPLKGKGFAFNEQKDPQRRYATAEMVSAIVDAAGEVQRRWPDSTLVVGDLSLAEGGAIDGHASHRNGRDVDVLFYLLREDGTPFASKAIPIEPDGSGVDYQDLSDASDDIVVRLDTRRTWAFLDALLSDARVQINRIFVAEHVRTLLMQYARSTDSNPERIERFGHLTCQPAFPHDDHMHIRLFCSPQDIDQGCEDTSPIYPWHRQWLAAQGQQPRIATPGNTSSPAKVTSAAKAESQARRKYGNLAPQVEAFLERRKQWMKKPSPGRPYCP